MITWIKPTKIVVSLEMSDASIKKSDADVVYQNLFIANCACEINFPVGISLCWNVMHSVKRQRRWIALLVNQMQLFKRLVIEIINLRD